jgi:CBS domain containing-hemolysin-like protein
MSDYINLGIALFLVLLNGFFVAAEFAIVKVRSTRIENLAEEGNPQAKVARRAVHHLDAYLSATQLGITIASIGLGWVGEPAVAHLIEPALKSLGGAAKAASHAIAVSIAFVIITFMHIVFGELVPKSIAIQRPEGATLWIAYPLDLFYRLFYPAIAAFNLAATLVLRLIRLRPATEHEVAHTEEEIRTIMAASERSGLLKDSELALVERVFEFTEERACEIMVPRVDIIYLSTTWPLDGNIAVANEHGHARYPLCEGDPDRVVGMVRAQDLVKLMHQREPEIRSIAREMLFVPETKPVDQLLREFQRRHIHMAIVLDEYGGTAGLVTLEDVIEEIVGEIQDEDKVEPPRVLKLGEGQYRLDGMLTRTDLKLDLNIDLETEADSLAGFILERLGTIPEPGEAVEAAGYRFEVEEMQGLRVRRVLATATRDGKAEAVRPAERQGNDEG